MALVLPTANEKYTQYLAYFENRLAQTSPLADKAFLRVLSAVLALHHIELYKYAAERALQNLALTATGEDLDTIGKEYEVNRIAATKTVLTATLNANVGTVIPATATFIGDSNGMRYFMQASVTTPAGGIAELTLVAEEEGVSGNLSDGELLTLTSAIAGADSQATIAAIGTNPSSTLTTGAAAETDAAYRVRVLDEIRRIGGGSNAADYRSWSREVAGVLHAYPYSGKPFGTGGPHYPPDRTVYIECTEDVDPDGIPPAGLLTQVRDSITTDPITALSRQALGLTDETLYVEAITPIELHLQIHELKGDEDDETIYFDAIEAAILAYVKTVRPWISGLDADGERRDRVTQVTLADVIQDALYPYNATAEHVFFGVVVGDYTVEDLLLNPGETLILGSIDYV